MLLGSVACGSSSTPPTLPAFPLGTEGAAKTSILGAFCDRLFACDPSGYSMEFQGRDDCILKASSGVSTSVLNGPSQCPQPQVDTCTTDVKNETCVRVTTGPDGGPGATLPDSCNGC